MFEHFFIYRFQFELKNCLIVNVLLESLTPAIISIIFSQTHSSLVQIADVEVRTFVWVGSSLCEA